MFRIAGVNLDEHQQVWNALRREIYGVGPVLARKACELAKIDPVRKGKDLTEEEKENLRLAVEKNFTVEGELRRQVTGNIKAKIDNGSYVGSRHRRNLPSRGQRTHTNARTRRKGKRV